MTPDSASVKTKLAKLVGIRFRRPRAVRAAPGSVEGLAAGVFEVIGIDLVAHASVGLGHWTSGCSRPGAPGTPTGARRRPGRRSRRRWRVLPQAAVFEDLADDLALTGFDEGDDLHGPATPPEVGAPQRVGVVHTLDEHRPDPESLSRGVGAFAVGDGLRLVVLVLIALLGAEAASFVGVVAVVADEGKKRCQEPLFRSGKEKVSGTFVSVRTNCETSSTKNPMSSAACAEH